MEGSRPHCGPRGSGFQEGLRDSVSGEEIPFESVDQIRELCRRGFLGGGLGPNAPGVGPIPYPTPEVGPGEGLAIDRERFSLGLETWEPRSIRHMLARLHDGEIYEIARCARNLTQLTIDNWTSIEHLPISHKDVDRVRDARHRMWLWLTSNGLIDHRPSDSEEYGVDIWPPFIVDRFGDPIQTGLQGAPPELRPNDFSLAPLPLAYRRHPLRRFAELMIIASITEDFPEDADVADYFAALAAWHMIKLARRRYPIAIDRERLARDAITEVARNAPPIRLPTAANAALDSWVHQLLVPPSPNLQLSH